MLLDASLSGLDAMVSSHVFEHCIQAMTTDRIVVLVTHQTHILSHASRILVLNEGMVQFDGSYNDLLHAKFDVSDMIGDVHATCDGSDGAKTSTSSIMKSNSKSTPKLIGNRNSSGAGTASSSSSGVTDISLERVKTVDTLEETSVEKSPFHIYIKYFKVRNGIYCNQHQDIVLC